MHGDYRLGNVIITAGKVNAVLDWELTTLGHPISDLAYLLNNWVDSSEASKGPITSPVAAGGFGDRSEVVNAYRDAGGARFDPGTLGFFRAFGYWRLASIRSGVIARLVDSKEPSVLAKVEQSRESISELLAAAHAVLDELDSR